MSKSTILFPVIQSFLEQMQSIELVKEYSLNNTEINDENFLVFESAFKKFVQGVNGVLSTNQESMETSEITPTEMNQNLDVNHEKDAKGMKMPIPDSKKNNVQLQVDGTEIKRRISAFLSRKRKEVEEWNVQEFCSRPFVDEQNPIWEQMDSCARVDAVFIPRFGSKSHVKVSKVENRWGPQTQFGRVPAAKRIKIEPTEEGSANQSSPSFEAIQERIQLMESHLNLNSDTSIRSSIFQRLKSLEDRILYLEGISPDYFTPSGPNYASPKKKNAFEKEKIYSNWSVDDIQKRIQALKESLKSKSQNKTDYLG